MNKPELNQEVRLPLEILANVIYLTKRHSEDPEKIVFYMELAEKALSDVVTALTGKSIGSETRKDHE